MKLKIVEMDSYGLSPAQNNRPRSLRVDCIQWVGHAQHIVVVIGHYDYLSYEGENTMGETFIWSQQRPYVNNWESRQRVLLSRALPNGPWFPNIR